MLEIVVTGIVCIIDFILMIIFVKDYSDAVLLFQIFSKPTFPKPAFRKQEYRYWQ